MNTRHCAVIAALAVSLTGCIEVEQHPAYVDGQYAGKRDNRVADVSFHGDNAAWKKAIIERASTQNEYNRAHP
ncbi:hypothetical protein [Massilia sp. PWRC2]|uniref:hypothetical protein n=1 Tax=Massilia sp. PWRC2 TaxID=2804626 RepID=UPI003CF0B9DB